MFCLKWEFLLVFSGLVSDFMTLTEVRRNHDME